MTTQRERAPLSIRTSVAEATSKPMKRESMNSPQLTRTDIGDWLRGRVMTYGELAPDSFSDDTPLADLGFTSVYALTLCGDIEDTFGLVVEPKIVWDHPTIRELAGALEGLFVRQ